MPVTEDMVQRSTGNASIKELAMTIDNTVKEIIQVGLNNVRGKKEICCPTTVLFGAFSNGLLGNELQTLLMGSRCLVSSCALALSLYLSIFGGILAERKVVL